jgi:low temperature requirement protein LtrA
MKGIESQETWSPLAASGAFSGVAALFGIWWWYFEVLQAAAERPVRSRLDAVRLHVWSYAHFPLYLGIVIIGVGIQRVVTHATHQPLPSGDVLMWTAGAILLVSAGAILRRTRLPEADHRARRQELPHSTDRTRRGRARSTGDTALGTSHS